MANSSANVSLCQLAKSLSDYTPLRIIYILEIITALAVVFTTSLTLYILHKVKVFHANLRLILANLTCNLAVFSISSGIKAYQRLISDPCTFPISLKTCIIQDYFVSLPAHNSLMTLIILSLERLYATIRYRSYDYSGSIPYLGTILIVSSWIVTFSMNIPNYFKVPNNIWIPICETGLAASRQSLIRLGIVNLSCEAIATLITTLVYIYNRYLFKHTAINRAMYGLSARFQINQNVQVNQALMPNMILHIFVYVPCYAVLTFTFCLDIPISINTKVFMLHLTLYYRLLYALMDPIILISMNHSLRGAMMKTELGKCFASVGRVFGGKNGNKEINQNLRCSNVMNVHFHMLEQAWDVHRIPDMERRKVKTAFT